MTSIRTMLTACVFALLIASAAGAAEPQVLFVVRHAERAASAAPAPPPGAPAMSASPDDPPLSPAGTARAARLAEMLRSADIKHVFTTELRRTRDTAAPTAQAAHIEVTTVPAKEMDALVAQIRQAKGNALVVGHSNTVPDLLKRLGIKDPVSIADSEYDNLFIVVRPEAGDPTLIRLRF